MLIRKWHLIPLFWMYLLLFSIPAKGQSMRRLEKLYKKAKYEKLVLRAEKIILKHPDNPQVYYYLIRGMLSELDTTRFADFENNYYAAAERYRYYLEAFGMDSLSLLMVDEFSNRGKGLFAAPAELSPGPPAAALPKSEVPGHFYPDTNEASPYSEPSTVPEGSLIVKKAEEVLNVPYLYAGMKPGKGFDCSGLVCWSYGQFGYILPHRSGSLAKIGTRVGIGEARAGDVVCFGHNPDDPGSIYHVGMIHSRNGDEILMIHSGNSEGVSIVPLTSGHWSKKDYFIVRILD